MRGPIPAGEQNDKSYFCGGNKDEPKKNWDKSALYFSLPEGMKAIGDSIYEGIPEKVTCIRKGQLKETQEFLNHALACQETYLERLAVYEVLRLKFRHNRDKMTQHKMCTEAVSVIVQYNMKYHPLFEV